MKYDAITLDTNIFFQNGFYLEGGLLGQLTQFKEGSVQLVLSEIVLKEVFKNLKQRNEELWGNLEQSLKKTGKKHLLSSESLKKIDDVLKAELSPEDAAKARLKKFIENTGAVIVEAKNADINELIKLYFAPSPPFEAKEDKKNEFPDAIALLSLDSWAKLKKKTILAISNDGGWGGYAQSSPQIDVEKDLSQAFQKFQQHVDQAKAIIVNLLTEISNGNKPKLLQGIESYIEKDVQSLDPYPDIQSHLSYDVEQVDLYYSDFEFEYPDEEFNFTIVQIGAGKIVVKVPVLVRVKADAQFSFYVYDSTDKDSIPMGENTAEADAELEMAVLITFEGDFASDPMEIEVTEATLLGKVPMIDFGYVEPFENESYEE